MAHDRVVAGVRCSEVMEDLSDYLDGQLAPERVERIDAHLRGCDWCERFGGRFADSVRLLRRHLAEPEPLPAAARSRLRERLASETMAEE